MYVWIFSSSELFQILSNTHFGYLTFVNTTHYTAEVKVRKSGFFRFEKKSNIDLTKTVLFTVIDSCKTTSSGKQGSV